MIESWRAEWGTLLPFFYVEMNNMYAPQREPVEPAPLCLIREEQQAALKLPKTGVVASIDLGIPEPHFPNKKPVGDRLAALALGEVYGFPKMSRRPEFLDAAFRPDGSVLLSFRHATGLGTREDAPIRGFALRGEEGQWHWADARLAGEQVILRSREVPKPTAVRYAWAENPIISLFNATGLPLRPFRTDTGSQASVTIDH